MILLFRVLLIDISNHFRPFVNSLEIKFKNNFSLCDYVLSVFFLLLFLIEQNAASYILI